MFIEKNRAGIWIRESDNIEEVLSNIFKDPYALTNMKINARLIAKKNSTKDICETLL